MSVNISVSGSSCSRGLSLLRGAAIFFHGPKWLPSRAGLFTSVAALCFTLPIQFSVRAEALRLDQGWEYHQGGLGSVYEIWRPTKPNITNVRWTQVTLPHCFNARDAVDPDDEYYEGPGWYRIRLKLDNPYPGGRTLLHFEGAGQKSKVFVGLNQVGEHIGGYDEWSVDITEAAAGELEPAGTNTTVPVAVLCDNSRDTTMIPSDLSDFPRYGGLYRHVELVYVPAISVERVHVQPGLSDQFRKGHVEVRVRLYDPASLKDEVTCTIELLNPKGRAAASTSVKAAPWSGEKAIAEFNLDSPELWSPDHPALYRCVVTLQSARGEQRDEEPFGFRSVEWVEHGPFKLNGGRLLLRGTHYHQDHAGVGAAVPDDVTRKTFQMIKDMGANFVRLAHYQQSPLVLKLCDQLGLLVWEEIPWCRGGLGGAAYQQQCRDMLRSMIDQHYNHPSIILWGLGNEDDWPGDFPTFNREDIRSFMTQLNALAHQLDSTRQTCIRRCDFCKDVVDVYSPSIWDGWYSGNYQDYHAEAEKALKSVNHFFHAEWGGDSLAGRYAEVPAATGLASDPPMKVNGKPAAMAEVGDWSESYICDLFDWFLKEQEQMPWLTGSAQWAFKDFATPARPANPIPYVNEKGLVQRDLTPKEGYYVFQSYWSKNPMVHVFGHLWTIRWGHPGEARIVKVYSNCREVELFLNGRSLGMKRRDSADFPAAGLRWQACFQEGPNTLRAVGHADGAEVTDEVSFQYQTARWGKPMRMSLKEVGQEGDVATVEARLLDRHGVPCLDAANRVRFGVAGEGELLDDLGTPGGSRVVELANGRAQISLRLTGDQAVASVTSEGLPTAFVTLTNASGNHGPEITARESLQAIAFRPGSDVSSAPDPGIDVAAIDRARILKGAEAALHAGPFTITRYRAKLSEGGPNDFYSNGDYWWPDPTKPNGLPYIQRDGESNPNNFDAHRMEMRHLNRAVAALGAAYEITGEDRYVSKAVALLRVFFLDPKTRMNPSLKYAQAIPGRTAGRGIGIIDSLHLIEVPRAIEAMEPSPAFPTNVLVGLKKWFSDYTDWMLTSTNGHAEAHAHNNHAVAFWLQVASFSQFTGDQERLAECRREFKEVFVPKQMASDGSFPAELRRTKPYGYSIFQLDNMATLCQVLSTPKDDLWSFQLSDGRGIRLAMQFLYPFLADKSKWPHQPDVQAWDGWPARQPSLLFAGLALHQQKYLELWRRLPPDPADPEVRRNIAITQPLLWLK